jgi:hypothetical protein
LTKWGRKKVKEDEKLRLEVVRRNVSSSGQEKVESDHGIQ